VIGSLPGFRALGSPRFRAYLLGQFVSLTGTWIQQVALAWLTFQITRSSAAVGIALACSQLPIFLLAPLAGVLNDRFDRRRVLVLTQLAGLVQALLLTATYATGTLHPQMIFALSAFGGLVSSLDTPARQSIIAGLVDRRSDIRNAVALNSASVHVARLLGPALAAVLLTKWDTHACFLANAASCVAFVVVLGGTRGIANEPIRRITFESLREGWRYCTSHSDTRQALAWIAIASLFAIPYTSLLPAAAHIWSVGAPISYAELMAAAGGGAVMAALVLAQIDSDAILRKAIEASLIVAALSLALLGIIGVGSQAAIIVSAVSVLGFTLTIVISGGNVQLQHHVPDALRGRVMGVFVMLFNGVAPLGALLWGLIADRLSISIALTSAGVMVALSVFLKYLLSVDGAVSRS
jgi:MFS family permease